jgi:catechol 2,3-dioxygenase-like lactoylglutathione lyase family enzyme
MGGLGLAVHPPICAAMGGQLGPLWTRLAAERFCRAIDLNVYRVPMASRLLAVTFDAHDSSRVAQFWATVLGREIVEHSGGMLLPGDDTHLGLRFVPSPADEGGRNPTHLHLTSSSSADQRRTVSTALDLGARHLDVGQTAEEGHVVLVDPDGNAFCVIEPGNSFLAGCGFLGELACDGTREVGLFWSEALGWPLVWDQNQETAIQSPLGGTKVAWGGPPVASHEWRNRHSFYLVAGDGGLGVEVERLVSLGATELPVGEDGSIGLSDPDGNEFLIGSR